MNQILLLYFVAGVLPSVAIYYFTNGNWPLAFKLQLGLLAVLLIAYVVLWQQFLTGGSGGGRGSNPIGAVGAIGAVLVFLAPLPIGVGLVALFYKGVPAGDPGLLVRPIKWMFLTGVASVLGLFIYHLINNNLYSKLYILPKLVKHPLYTRLLEDTLSPQRRDQLEESLRGEMKESDNLDTVLILSRNKSLLYAVVDSDSEYGNFYRETVLTSLCDNVTETGYPDHDVIKNIYYGATREEEPSPNLVLILLDCMKKAGAAPNSDYTTINDNVLTTKIWDDYPDFRHAIWPHGEKRKFLQNRVRGGDDLPDITQAAKSLIYALRYYDDKNSSYEAIQYLISNFPHKIDYTDGILHQLAIADNAWSYRLLYENEFPDSAWKAIRYDKDLLNGFTDNNDVRIKLAVRKNDSPEDKAEVKQILEFLDFLKDKGMNTFHHKGDYDVTAQLLRERYGLTGFVDE